MSIRTERVASLLKEEIGALLSREYRDPSYGFLTVTEVRVSADLKTAKVAVSVLGTAEAQLRAIEVLEEQRPQIQRQIASHLRMKFTPVLHFYLDETMERANRINVLLKRLHDDDTKGSTGE